ncbi:hypothetical protein FIBSPDRAFT_230073 [Athelia psychrophila]|uniref:Uncharacterized protein n=1 Tax=Athelia psychrophila TaxID=1759441 RepID=A0A165YPN9_9AGAM|nr:hypothetical protein FIBSPDRAFT_230073 [Fibularhizoctonia sp. CBS 109695]
MTCSHIMPSPFSMQRELDWKRLCIFILRSGPREKLHEHALVLRALHTSLTSSSLSASEKLATLCTRKDLVREVYTAPVSLSPRAKCSRRTLAHLLAVLPQARHAALPRRLPPPLSPYSSPPSSLAHVKTVSWYMNITVVYIFEAMSTVICDIYLARLTENKASGERITRRVTKEMRIVCMCG